MKTILAATLGGLAFALCGCSKKDDRSDNYITYKGEKYITDSCYVRNTALVAVGHTDNYTKFTSFLIDFTSLPTTSADYPLSNGSGATWASVIAQATGVYSKLYRTVGTTNATMKIEVRNGKIAATCEDLKMSIYPISSWDPTPAPDTIDMVVHIAQTQ